MIRLLRRCHLPLLALVSFFQLLALALCRVMPESAPVLALFCVLCLAVLLLCAAVGAQRSVLRWLPSPRPCAGPGAHPPRALSGRRLTNLRSLGMVRM